MLLALPIIGCLFILDKFTNEDRDYALQKKVFALVRDLDSYKQKHGTYPASLSEAGLPTKLCVFTVYQKCREVEYKPINKNTDFRMAMKSFTWVILWYRKDYCIDVENHPTQNTDELYKKNGALYYFCAASAKGSREENSFPVYRNSKPVFDKPEEWPIL